MLLCNSHAFVFWTAKGFGGEKSLHSMSTQFFPTFTARSQEKNLTVTANQEPTLTLDIYEIHEDTAFAKSYRNYLDPAYETMKNYGVGFEMVLYASLFLPFIHFYL